MTTSYNSIAAHAETTRLTIHETVRQLTNHLGPVVVALLANVSDRKLPYKWSAPGGQEPRDHSKQRLMLAHRIWSELISVEEHRIARNWFIGANPRLGEASPAEALREGRFSEVKAAATAFLERPESLQARTIHAVSPTARPET